MRVVALLFATGCISSGGFPDAEDAVFDTDFEGTWACVYPFQPDTTYRYTVAHDPERRGYDVALLDEGGSGFARVVTYDGQSYLGLEGPDGSMVAALRHKKGRASVSIGWKADDGTLTTEPDVLAGADDGTLRSVLEAHRRRWVWRPAAVVRCVRE